MQDAIPDDRLAEAADVIGAAKAVVVLTGSGVSAESGVPTFRDALTGHWSRYDPAQLATPEAFTRDPELVTRWYDERRMACLACAPNPGHAALARLEAMLCDAGRSFELLTQNVDRLHYRAGSRDPVELHGSLFVWRCTRTGRELTPPDEPFGVYPPRSEDGGLLRPGVVWFGEMLPERALDRAEAALRSCDVFVAIGTSAVVYPAAGFAEVAAARGARTIEINPDETPITDMVDFSLRGPAGRVLPELVERAGAGITRG